MDAATLFYTIVSVVGGILLGAVAYFLKRTMDLVDGCVKDIKALNDGKVGKDEFKTFRDETKEKFGKISRDIEGIREDYITKEDFFREQAKTDRKLDMILDILLERKSKGG